MNFVDLALSREQWGNLRRCGLNLSGLSAAGRIAAASRFEWPTSVQARIPWDAILDIGAFCNLNGTLNNVRIARYGSIAKDVAIGSHEHPTDWLTTSRTAYYPQVNGWDDLMAGPHAAEVHARKRKFSGSCPITEIGPDVWIGHGVFIKAGVRIGAGAVIGAHATVLRDVPPYAIVVGTPGKVVRLRFPEATVERLMKLEWWRFNIYDLFDAPMDDIEAAIDKIEEMEAAGRIRPYEGAVVTGEDLTDPDAVIDRLRRRAQSVSRAPADNAHKNLA